jgi:hypothetical protein
MTLSKTQIEYEKIRYQKWFWIWERDLHWLAEMYGIRVRLVKKTVGTLRRGQANQVYAESVFW